jgi:hypothetical protein
MFDDSLNDTTVENDSQQSANWDDFEYVSEEESNATLDTKRYLQSLVKPNQIVEIRCLDAMLVGDKLPYNKPRVIAGWFDNAESILSEIKKISKASGIYITINPCSEDLLARANNQLKSKISTTTDEQIVTRQLLLIDIDPDRLAGIPSTDSEHQSALNLAQTIRDTLKDVGFPDPIMIDSGNGAYLEYAIDMPTQDDGLIQRVLQGLAKEFNTDQVHIDLTTFNPARIARVPGTLNAKGDGTPDRPHRLAKLLSVPDSLQIVTRDQLETIAVPVEQPKASSKKSSSNGSTQGNQQALSKAIERVDSFIAKHNIQVKASGMHNGDMRYQIEVCAWNPDHTDDCMTLFARSDGKLGANCNHNSCEGKGWNEYKQIFEPEKKKPKSLDLPQFIIEGQMREQVQKALGILEDANEHNPEIFVHLSLISKVVRDEEEKPCTMPVDRAVLRNELNDAANFYYEKEAKNEEGEKVTILVDADPPKDIADQILALAPSDWPFPALKSIVEVPVLRSDGSILNTAGYDPSTRLYYVPGPGMERCKIPTNPTQMDAIAAMAYIKQIFQDFPFEGDADKANVIALLLTPFLRHAVKKDIQMALIDATNAGTGKGLICNIISIVATGMSTTPMSAKQSDEEWRKAILTELLKSPRLVVIDNVRGVLESATLEMILTGLGINERILGQSKSASPKNEATWMCTGNNLLIGGDLARRCYRIRLISQTATPEERTDFAIPEIEQWCIDNRPEIVSAILTVIRAWYASGKPKPKNVPNLGTFTDWAKTVGGILEFAGIEGFQGNRAELRSRNNEEAQEWEAFLSAIHQQYGNDWNTSGDIAKKIKEDSANEFRLPANNLFDPMPQYLKKSLAEKEKSFPMTLAVQLGKRVQTVYGSEGYRLEKSYNEHLKQKTWRVLRVVAGSQSSHASENFSEESSENTRAHDTTTDTPNYNLHASGVNYPQLPAMEDSQAQNGDNSAGSLSKKSVDYPQDEVLPPNHEAQFWAIGRRLGYPSIPDLDLGQGMIEWSSFIMRHRLTLPDVIARLGGK